jgi:hypothetical protein
MVKHEQIGKVELTFDGEDWVTDGGAALICGGDADEIFSEDSDAWGWAHGVTITVLSELSTVDPILKFVRIDRGFIMVSGVDSDSWKKMSCYAALTSKLVEFGCTIGKQYFAIVSETPMPKEKSPFISDTYLMLYDGRVEYTCTGGGLDGEIRYGVLRDNFVTASSQVGSAKHYLISAFGTRIKDSTLRVSDHREDRYSWIS